MSDHRSCRICGADFSENCEHRWRKPAGINNEDTIEADLWKIEQLLDGLPVTDFTEEDWIRLQSIMQKLLNKLGEI